MELVKKIDVFSALPKDLSEPTFCGGLISMVCTVIIVTLGFSESFNYLSSYTSSKIILESTHNRDKFQANIDIVFSFIPCDVIGLSLFDILNNQVLDYHGDLKKHRVNSEGRVTSTYTDNDTNDSRTVLVDRIMEELDSNKGCRFIGMIELYRVPGVFMFNSHHWKEVTSQIEHRRNGY